jgi:hypothetical protein
VPPLAELQSRVTRALLDGDLEPLAPLLVGGGEPGKRFDIHRRHYEASLTEAVGQKFPATAWLVGADSTLAAARAYVRARPPDAPCIAEYGADFPAFIAHCVGRGLAYLEAFAALEWAVGQVSIATELTRLEWPAVAALGTESLVDARVALQPGLRYLRSAWRVDELFHVFLGEVEPERFVLANEDAAIEVRGARGTVSVARIADATCEFRSALASGRTIGEAAGAALQRDGSFDVGRALRVLVGAGLVTGLA